MKPLGFTAFLGLAILTSAYAGDDGALKKELAMLEGKWTVVKFDAGDGKDVDTMGATLEFFKESETVITGEVRHDAERGAAADGGA